MDESVPVVGLDLVKFLLKILKLVEIENEALRRMLKDRGTQDGELRQQLDVLTEDPNLVARVAAMIDPVEKLIVSGLQDGAMKELLAKWRPKGRLQ
jgi:hypothetical protein